MERSVEASTSAASLLVMEASIMDFKELELDDRATAEVEQVVAQTLAFHGH